jgi:hypothetical protein
LGNKTSERRKNGQHGGNTFLNKQSFLELGIYLENSIFFTYQLKTQSNAFKPLMVIFLWSDLGNLDTLKFLQVSMVDNNSVSKVVHWFWAALSSIK